MFIEYLKCFRHYSVSKADGSCQCRAQYLVWNVHINTEAPLFSEPPPLVSGIDSSPCHMPGTHYMLSFSLIPNSLTNQLLQIWHLKLLSVQINDIWEMFPSQMRLVLTGTKFKDWIHNPFFNYMCTFSLVFLSRQGHLHWVSCNYQYTPGQ